VPLRRILARWVVRHLLRPALDPARPLAERRAAAVRHGRLLPPVRGVRIVTTGGDEPGGCWLLPAGTTPGCPRGAWLYLHGGGFVLGSPATHRAVAARLAGASGRPVFLLDYRLAPEHPYPAALNDALSAWRWMARDDTRPVAVAGDSAGGWLALALAQRLAAGSPPKPAGLALFSPLLDLAAAELPAEDFMLPAAFVAEGARAWRGGLSADDRRLDLLGGEVAGLPPVFLSFDRDERLAADGRRLAVALQAAGVALRVEESQGLVHAWPLLAGLLPEAQQTLAAAAATLFPDRERCPLMRMPGPSAAGCCAAPR
jgi:epsilon-lactone hydrolase